MSATLTWGVYKEHSESGNQERMSRGSSKSDNLDLELLRRVIVLDDDELVEWITVDLDKTR